MGSNTPQKYRPRATVEAIQWDGTNSSAIAEWTGCETTWSSDPNPELYIAFPKQRGLIAKIGDWIICGTTGGFFTCQPDAFLDNYDPEAGTADPTPEHRIGAAQLRVMAARQVADQAQQALKDAERAAAQATTQARTEIEFRLTPAQWMKSFDEFQRTLNDLSPNAQRMVNAFRGDQP